MESGDVERWRAALWGQLSRAGPRNTESTRSIAGLTMAGILLWIGATSGLRGLSVETRDALRVTFGVATEQQSIDGLTRV